MSSNLVFRQIHSQVIRLGVALKALISCLRPTPFCCPDDRPIHSVLLQEAIDGMSVLNALRRSLGDDKVGYDQSEVRCKVPNRRSFLLAVGASCLCAQAGSSPRSFTIRVIDPAGYALDSARWHLGLSEQTPLQTGKVDKEGKAKLSFEWQPGLTLYLEADGFLPRDLDLEEERLGLWTIRLSLASCSSPHVNCDSFVPLKRKARRQKK